jgi:hypothetical protein
MLRKHIAFAEALEALNKGKMVSREIWKNSGELIFMQIPSEIPKSEVQYMQSLPESVKAELEKRFANPDLELNSIFYENQLALMSTRNLIVGFSPSVSDVMAEDWFVIEES